MITKNDKIKCDWCGCFISYDEADISLVNYIPDTIVSTEAFEHKCQSCKVKERSDQ